LVRLVVGVYAVRRQMGFSDSLQKGQYLIVFGVVKPSLINFLRFNFLVVVSTRYVTRYYGILYASS